MKISELIEQLKNYPQDLQVVVSGHEGGYDDIIKIQKIKVMLNHNEDVFRGKNEMWFDKQQKADDVLWIV